MKIRNRGKLKLGSQHLFDHSTLLQEEEEELASHANPGDLRKSETDVPTSSQRPNAATTWIKVLHSTGRFVFRANREQEEERWTVFDDG